ncbi:MAG: hypothetical protein HOH48_02535 [Candidatus Puniceispirillum sp.]|nr:hypothetical protein [Candidatus Puniceispirillum sp.]
MIDTVTHIYFDEAPGQTRVVFIRGNDKGVLALQDVMPDTIVEIWHRRWDMPSLIGTVHFARIEQLFIAQNRATAQLHDGTAISVRLRAKDRPASGDIRAVTITAAPREDKSWQAVLGARLVSPYGILLPASSGVFRSNRFSASDNGKAQEAMIKTILPDDFGFIMRSSANALSVDAMEADVKALLHAWQMGTKVPSGQMHMASAPCLIHDGGGLTGQVARHAPHAQVIDAHETTAKQYLAIMLDEVIDDAMQTKVPLPHGGQLWCQRTNALWAIDVDSAGYNSPKANDMIPYLLMDAVPEIIRQVRLRAMGGAILVDMPRMASKAGKTVLAQFSEACAGDPRHPEIMGFTRGGLLEMRVPHGEQTLPDVMADRIAQCALAGLRLVAHRIALPPAPTEIKLAVSAPVAKWLSSEGSSACAALDRPLRPVVLSDVAPDAPAYIIN